MADRPEMDPAAAGEDPAEVEGSIRESVEGHESVEAEWSVEAEDTIGQPHPHPYYEPWADPSRNWEVGPPPTSHTGPMLAVEKQVLEGSRLLDRIQSKVRPIAFMYAVFKKYADDEGSRLAALLAYYSFLSLFPLAIGGFAILNEVLQNRPDLVVDLVERVVPAAYQAQIIDAYQSLPPSGSGFVIAIVGLLLSGTSAVFSLYAMVNQIFCVPYRFRYGFGPRYLRVFLLVFLLGVSVLVVAAGSAFVSNVGHIASIQRFGALVLIWAVGTAVLFIAPNVLARRQLTIREVLPGAALGALAMTLVFGLGSRIVAGFVANSSAVYGAFATVVGVFSVMFLISNAIAFCYEIGVVWAWKLWPRGIDIQLLFPADERAYALLTLMDERMPSQRNGLQFDATGHDDARRISLESIMRRPEGVPKRPYDEDADEAADGAAGAVEGPKQESPGRDR